MRSTSIPGPRKGAKAANALKDLLTAEIEAGWSPEDAYAYRSGDGGCRFIRLRLERSRGRGRRGATTSFQAVHHDGSRWRLGEPALPAQGRPLYLPPTARTETETGQAVYLVQDEGTADALGGIGLTAASSGEGLAVHEADWSALRERRWRLWVEDSLAGRRYAAAVLKQARALGCAVEAPDANRLAVLERGGPRHWLAANAGATAAEVEALGWKACGSAGGYGPSPLPLSRVAGEGSSSRLETVRAMEIVPQAMQWLWPGRIAMGKLTLIAGDPGLGKSLLMLAFAAQVTRGWRWAAGDVPCPQGEVLLVCGEDSGADTVRPRLDAAGADVAQVHILQWVTRDGAEPRLLSLKDDVRALAAFLAEHPQVRLVCIDPISAFLGEVDSNRSADVRAMLQPLSILAERTGVAIVVVSHLNKFGRSALHRISGSLAFVAAARAAYIVTRDHKEPSRRLLLPGKNNLAQDGGGMAYHVVTDDKGMPCVEWEVEPVERRADEALSARGEAEESEQREAVEWLRQMLGEGGIPATQMRKEAAGAGIAWRTLHRAKRAAGAVSMREGFGREAVYMWRLKGVVGYADLRTGTDFP